MSQTSDPVHEALARYSAAAYDKNVDAFVSLYADDVHVFDMWNSWELRGIGAWRDMAVGWFSSLGDERVVVSASDVVSNCDTENWRWAMPRSRTRRSLPTAGSCVRSTIASRLR